MDDQDRLTQIEARLTAAEERVTSLEGRAHREAWPKSKPGLIFQGFAAHEPVELGVRSVGGAGAEPLTTASADAGGKVAFSTNFRLRPGPGERVYVARGTVSDREVTRPLPT